MASSARIDELKKKFDENPRRYFAPLANEYRKVGDLDQALFICEAYLPQQPGHMSGHIVYAQTLFEIGRFDDAKAAFGSALALDPENLIALRHLGDIARHAGDIATAREWYQRVLETDPRNEEIVEVMASLSKVTSDAPSSAAAASDSPRALWTPPVSAPPPMRPPTPAAAAPPADDFAADDNLLDLDSMMIGETPLSTPAVPAPAASAEEHTPFEADPRAFAASEPPTIELATDVNLGLVDDGTQSDVAPAPDAEPLEGLRSFEAGILPERAEIVDASLEMEPFYDILHGEAAPAEEQAPEFVAPLHEDKPANPVESDTSAEVEETFSFAQETPAIEWTDRAVTPAASSPPVREPTPPVAGEIFVTETMAELYLQQGHLDSALDIYRKLLEQRPNDASLIERVRSVEERVFGPPASPAADSEAYESVDVALSADADAGPTIREFLSALVGGRNPRRSQANGSSDSSSMQTTSRHTLPGSIDAMFPHADASRGDSSAATALGEAFGMDELDAGSRDDSVRQSDDANDAVLSGRTPPFSQASDGFSFDQFFAGDTNVAPAKPSSAAEAAQVESPEDIAQFNAWLSGLKKT